MLKEALKKSSTGTFHGFLLLDEMAIQQDLQIIKRGEHWSVVGSVDLGPICNNFEDISKSLENAKWQLIASSTYL